MVDVDGQGVVGQVAWADTEEVEKVFEEADKCSPDLSANELRKQVNIWNPQSLRCSAFYKPTTYMYKTSPVAEESH